MPRAWLVIVVLVACGCDRSERPPAPAADAPAAEPAWFTDVTASLGLSFTHDAGATGAYRMEEIMGSGGAMFDYDGDGRLDVLLINADRAAGARDALYRQRADGTFENVTEAAGFVPGDAYGMGCALGDCDNDGDLDVYLTNLGPDELWRNNGDGTFTDVTTASGIDNRFWSVSALFFDDDLDGDLDLYVANYLVAPHHHECLGPLGKREYCAPQNFQPVPDRLYRNRGDGTFEDVSDAAGISRVAGPGLGVLCADYNLDGRPDVYVANDAKPNHLWINRGDGTFSEEAALRGCAYNRYGHAEAGMGVAIGDVDADGRLDLFMAHLEGESNTLYRMLEHGGFEDATDGAGLGLPSLPYTGFGAALFDVELDGDLDALVVNGAIKRRTRIVADASVPDFWKPYAEPNLLHENDGTGRFVDASSSAGDLCAIAEVSRGLAVADIDGDGDLDALVVNDSGPARLFRNEAPRAGRWLAVRAFDPGLNRDAIGAVVTVRAGGRSFQRLVLANSSYACASQPVAHFGLGPVEAVDEVEILWPDGVRERFREVPLDTITELQRGRGTTLADEGVAP